MRYSDYWPVFFLAFVMGFMFFSYENFPQILKGSHYVKSKKIESLEKRITELEMILQNER